MKVFIIDAFTDKPFSGNPAGVCLPEKEPDPGFMQSIAAELNLSETAFIRRSATDETTFFIRYFTPAMEIGFCGHATLAAAKFILHGLHKPRVSFITTGNLELQARADGEQIRMNFPLYSPEDYEEDEALYDALGISNPIASKSSPALEMLLVEVADKETLLSLRPDYDKALLATNSLKEVVVTARSEDSDYDFYSRCFCPWIGINEDPVTGAAHSLLTPYWGAILNKTEMAAFQCSDRGGFMRVAIRSASEIEVVSQARIVFEGTIFPDQ